ncbi:MAG TPA: NAD(P)-binding domain-containing protein, partial [Ktedonobacterales bacterium]|nr:NAD(P)-binding domain-containing protein [Ktedonobacterales bacterium]
MVDASGAAHEASPTSPALLHVGVIGAGAVGGALLVALSARGAVAGMKPVAVASRTFAHAQAAAARAPGCEALDSLDALAARCDLVFIATSDDAISSVAEAVAWRRGQAVAHLSGAQGVAPLAAAAARGASVAALHPLMTFPRALRDADPAQTLARLA